MLNLTDKKACCGCGACTQACPLNCIKLEAEREGFWYPAVDRERCVECGACEKVCPMLHPGDKPEEITVFAAYCPEKKVRETSSSGGIFPLLAEMVLANGGAVFGAAFDTDYSVHHIMITSREELPRLKGSKYVQSVMDDSYRQAEEQLRFGLPVLFTGTGCQIAGLRSYLRREYENLFTVEILCHGVPSPRAWQTYLNHQRETFGSPVQTASFRCKDTGWRRYAAMLKFENGQVYCRPHGEDAYSRLFLSEICLRPSCHDCRFRESRSGADLTIGDAWGIERWMPELDDDRGTSVVIVNTPRGRTMMKGIEDRLQFRRGDPDVILSCNMVYRKSVRPHPNRRKFFDALEKGASMEELTALCRRPFWHRLLASGKQCVRKAMKICGIRS